MIYDCAASLSGVDVHGAPLLTKLETVLDYYRETLNVLGDDFVIDRILQIHAIVAPNRISEYLSKVNSGGR